MKNEIILKAENTGKNYNDSGRIVTAVDSVNLEVHKGDFVIIMGASGSGKSSLLFLLSCLEKCDTGSIMFRDKRIDTARPAELAELRRKAFGFVFQGIHLVPYLSLRENVRIASLTAGNSISKTDEMVSELMEGFSLGEAQYGLPSRVSGGEAQRAAVARAIINKPEILFADEPTGSLNHSAGSAILESFAKLNAEGQTIVLVTHELNAACYGNRVIFMRDGKLHGELNMKEESKEISSFEQRRMKLVSWLDERGW